MTEHKARTAAEMVEAIVTFIRGSFIFWKRSTVVFLLVAIVSVPAVFLKARTFRSETIVLYQETIRSTDLTGGEIDRENARRVGARLKEMLLSRASLEPIVKEQPRYALIANRRSMVDAVDELRGHISFKAREGDTFEIGFDGNSPQEVQDVTSRLGDRIVQEAASRRAEQAKALKEFLDAESDRNKTSLRTSEGEFSRFLVLHPEFLPLTLPGAGRSQTASTTLPGTPGHAKDPALFALEQEAATIDRQLRGARGAAPAPQAAPVESPEVVAARKDLAEKLALYTDKHPDVVAAQARLRAAEAAAKALPAPSDPVAPAKLSDAEKEEAEQRLTTLRRLIAARRAGSAPMATSSAGGTAAAVGSGAPIGSAALEGEFRRIQREVEDLRERQRQLDEKQFKASITASSIMSDRNIQVSILDPAFLPAHPISRSRSVSLATFLAVGLILAIVTALVSARLDDRIHGRADLEVLDILPILGVIPRAAAARRERG